MVIPHVEIATETPREAAPIPLGIGRGEAIAEIRWEVPQTLSVIPHIEAIVVQHTEATPTVSGIQQYVEVMNLQFVALQIPSETPLGETATEIPDAVRLIALVIPPAGNCLTRSGTATAFPLRLRLHSKPAHAVDVKTSDEGGLNGRQIKLAIDVPPKSVEVLKGELIERKIDYELPGIADD